MHIFKNTHFDFLRWRWHAIGLSWVIIIAGIVTLATKGIPKGVEFAGGTVVIEKFEQPVSVQQVREALDRNYPGGGQNTVVQSFGDPALRMVMIRVPQVGSEAGASLTVEAQKVEDALDKANLGKRTREGAEIVGLTSGASAPEWLVEQMLGWLADRGFDRVEQALITEERVRFALPPGVRATTAR